MTVSHTMRRRRHLPLAMGGDEREQWVAGRYLAMESLGGAEARRERLLASFFSTATGLPNPA
jgi:hemoglobin